MKIYLKYLQWLFFWFCACIPLATMSAGVSALNISDMMILNWTIPADHPKIDSK